MACSTAAHAMRVLPPMCSRLQALQDVSDNWEVLHYDLHMGGSPVSSAWRAGEATDEQLAEVCVVKPVVGGAEVWVCVVCGCRVLK